jgi:hypothetical protein
MTFSVQTLQKTPVTGCEKAVPGQMRVAERLSHHMGVTGKVEAGAVDTDRPVNNPLTLICFKNYIDYGFAYLRVRTYLHT